MFQKFKAMFAFMTAFFAGENLIKDGQLNLTEDQHQQLQEALGEKVKLDEVVNAMNQELADLAKAEDENNDGELQDLRKKAQEMLIAHGLSKEDSRKLTENPSSATEATEKEILKGLTSSMAEMDKKIKKLMEEPEVDTPVAKGIQPKNTEMKHSSTHLFGSGQQYDAFEGRAWNKMAAGLSATAPTFAADSLEVQTLKDDMELYNRNVDSQVNSLFRDFIKLPSFWPIRTNVDDRVADGNIVSAEITQPRKKGWLPKNKQLIQPEEAKIYPVQVDIEHAGYVLQSLLTSWLASYNKEGSQAYKMSFVAFLNQEINKRARQEDRIVAIKGIYSPTTDNTTVPGLAINRGDGLLIKLWRAYFYDKKYKVAQIGSPTPSNIVDYIKELIESNIPEEERNNSGLVLYTSPTWVRAHAERKRVLFGQDNNYTGQELLEVENYPNIKLCPMVDFEGTDFMFITYDDNIEILENIPGEKSMYHIETLKRNIFIFGDYKFGIRVKHIGTKVKNTDPAAFKVQTVWTNGLPPFKSDFFVRMYDTATGEVSLPYSSITVADDWDTNIETITNTYEGQIVRIQGNTAANGVVVDTGNITLAGNADWPINSGGILTLRVGAGGALTEIKRTTAPATTPPSDVNFSGTVVDADAGYVFKYTGGAATLTAITGGVEGQEIVINGGANGTLTIDDVAGNVDVVSTAALLNASDNLTLTMIDGVWTEVARTI